MKILILTTDPSLTSWKSLPNKLAACEAAIDKGKNADFGPIEVLYFHTKPIVIGGKIDRDWLETLQAPYFRAGYDIIALHSSEAQWRAWGIQGSLRGANPNSSNELEALYFSANETSRRKNFNRFVQVFLHELAHGYYDHSGQLDLVHAWHDHNADITGLFENFDWSLYQPGRMALKKNLAQTQFNVLTFVGQLLKNMSYRLDTKPTLFAAATEYLGREASPNDLAPDELACAESVTNIIDDVLPDFPVITGTWTLWQALENDDRFKLVTVPMPGAIIISPTGTLAKAPFPGHVGIFGRDLNIMSNDSYTGLWQQNYSLAKWNKRWGKAGFPVFMYQLIK